MAVQPTGKITFELVSPERLLVSQPVDMVVVPGSEGLFGALIGHSPLIAMLRPGVIDVHDGGKITDRIFVAGGFAEVTPERCVVLAEAAQPVSELERSAVVARLEVLKNDAEGAAAGELEIQQAMLAAIDQKAA